jgi:hypothetical protein
VADKMIHPPLGRLNPAIVAAMAQTRSISKASEQASLMMLAQFSLGPRLAPEPKVRKATSAQRRAARIAAGALKVVDGRLTGV